jgi:sugar/nucleoside kinase (ribokinase family)
MREYDILVIGELNVDIILSGTDLEPGFGQAEKLVQDASLTLGSSSAIFACGASRLGLKVAYAGKVGDDVFGHFMINTLQERGVDTSPVVIDSSIKTGLTLHLSRPTDRAMLTYLGSIAAFRPEELDKSLFTRTRHIHVGSYFLQTGIQAHLSSLFAEARQSGVTVSLDPGWDPAENWNNGLHKTLRQVDIFLPNHQEAIAIARSISIQQAVESLTGLVPLLVVKLGAEGAMAASRQSGVPVDHRCHGFQVETVETTGAGDSFDAGFLYGYLNGFSIQESLRWACAVGALSTTRIGGIEGQPEVQEVAHLVKRAVQ